MIGRVMKLLLSVQYEPIFKISVFCNPEAREWGRPSSEKIILSYDITSLKNLNYTIKIATLLADTLNKNKIEPIY